jgi:CheY-like chemotaxis protein
MRQVLVADDDPGIRGVLQVVLEDEGYNVATVKDGAEAVAFLTGADEACVVLLDVCMPYVTGLEVCSLLHRSIPDGGRHRVLLMTAGLFSEQDLPHPARCLIRKPFELTTVLDAVAALAADLVANDDAKPSDPSASGLDIRRGAISGPFRSFWNAA